jgi:hypothetical protein
MRFFLSYVSCILREKNLHETIAKGREKGKQSQPLMAQTTRRGYLLMRHLLAAGRRAGSGRLRQA